MQHQAGMVFERKVLMEYVYLIHENMMAELVSLGAHMSLIRYSKDGVLTEEYVLNDEFEAIEDD